ncbi:MAG: hypothetical protein QXJ97_10710 [Desulfurococcaceae archaeon]
MPTIEIFGKTFIVRQLKAPRFKKKFSLANPPPWYNNPDELKPGHVAQIIRMGVVALRTRDKPLAVRNEAVKVGASGSTGWGRGKQKIYMPRMAKIISLADKYGIPVPEELRRAVREAQEQLLGAPVQVVPRIRE